MTITNLKSLVVFVFAVTLLSSCANSAHIEKDPSINLGSYKTYSWAEAAKDDVQNKNQKNDLTEVNVHKAVNQELEKNGFTEVKRNPDLLLTYDLLVEKSSVT